MIEQFQAFVARWRKAFGTFDYHVNPSGFDSFKAGWEAAEQAMFERTRDDAANLFAEDWQYIAARIRSMEKPK